MASLHDLMARSNEQRHRTKPKRQHSVVGMQLRRRNSTLSTGVASANPPPGTRTIGPQDPIGARRQMLDSYGFEGGRGGL